jgi:hypothetical protein
MKLQEGCPVRARLIELRRTHFSEEDRMNRNDRTIALDLVLLSLVALFSVMIRYEGWRSQNLVDADMLPYYAGAERQIQTGAFLDHGDLSSYNSFAPPGTVYWILLGAAFLRDVRLFALPANILLNLASVWLLYFILKSALGRKTALAAGLVYGISLLGYQSVWPIGHPLYILLVLGCTALWVQKRNGWMLFAAGAVGAFGLYVDLAILPFLFIPFVAWLAFRPPLRLVPILAMATVGLFIWLPYLRYEASKNFIDIRSILTLSRITPEATLEAKGAPPYCFATLPGEPDMRDDTYIPYLGSSVENRLVYPEPGIKSGLYYRACAIFLNMDRNFDGGYFISAAPLLGSFFWVFFMMGMFQALAMIFPPGWTSNRALQRFASTSVWRVTAVSVLMAGGLFLLSGLLLQYGAFGKERALFLVLQQAQYFLPLLLIALPLGIYLGLQTPSMSPEKAFTLCALWIPWLLVVLLAEPGRPERFWWLWPLQVGMMLMAFFRYGRALKAPAWLAWVVTIALIVAVFPASKYIPRMQNILSRGYPGEESEQVRIVDYIGQSANLTGSEYIAVGYSFHPEDSRPVASDPMRWPGTWFDLLLQTRWKMVNTDHDPQGTSRLDHWRILTPPQLPCRQEDADMVGWSTFNLVYQSGPFCLFEAQPSA